MPSSVVDVLGFSDFYALNMYYNIGFGDTFRVSTEAFDIGVGFYYTIYAVILVLIVTPAYVDESSYLMTAPVDEAEQRWYRGYGWILLLQTTHVGVAQAYTMISVVVVQLHALFGEVSTELLPLYAPGCRMTPYGELNAGELPPSCLLMERSLASCQMQTLFSNPSRVQFFSTIILSFLFLVYALLYGRRFSTYCTIGRLQLAVVILCSCTTLLHFFGAVPRVQEVLASPKSDGGFESWKPFAGLETRVLLLCIDSLGIGSFGLTVLGARVDERVRQNFLLLAAAICFSDFGVNVSSSLINVMRRTAIESLCSFNGSTRYNRFMELNVSAEQFGRSRMLDVEDYGVTHMTESIMMFRETSGLVPWTVLLPFHLMALAFNTMIICIYFYICDLQAATVFTQSRCSILLQSAARFGLLAVLEFLYTTGSFPEIREYMNKGTLLALCLLRMAQCCFIHIRQGYTEYLLSKRRLIPSTNYMQQFVFDWYIGPAIVYLYNLGYPLIFALAVLQVLSVKFAIFFLATNVLPSSVAMTVSHFWPL